jgi:hypothetical protein
MGNFPSRQVIYRQPLPPVRSSGMNSGIWEGIHLLRLIGSAGVIGGAVLYLMGWLVALILVLAVVGGIAAWRYLSGGQRMFYPNFAAVLGDDLEVAGPGIAGGGAAKKLPLRELTGWFPYRKTRDAFGEIEGLEFAHGKHTYRLAIDHADLFEMAPLEPYAADAIARLRRGT